MKKIYKYSFSRHTLSLTTIYLTIFLALGIGLYFLYEGGYLSAWFFSFIVALVALMSLSIPRRILVDDEGLHILCLLDITELHPEEIASVRQVEKQELRGYVPYFGGYGFFRVLRTLFRPEKSRKGQNLRFRMAEFRRNHRYL